MAESPVFVTPRCLINNAGPAQPIITDATGAATDSSPSSHPHPPSQPPPVAVQPPKLPIFSGQPDSPTSLFDFTSTVREVLHLCPIYNNSAILWLKRGLTGIALKECSFYLRDNVSKTVEDVLEFLEKRFNPDIHVTYLFSEFYPRKQQFNESIYEFSHVLQDLYQRILRLDPFSITDYNLRDTFVLNLYNPQLKLHLLPCLNDDNKSFEEVKTLALLYEKQMAQFSRPDGDTNAMVSVQAVSQPPIHPPSSVPNIPPPSVLCHWCQQPGHIERFCKAKEAYFSRRRSRAGNFNRRM